MLSLAQACAVVDEALAFARASKCDPMTVAALDARGCIVMLKMEDGAGLLRPEIASGKAWSALAMGFRTTRSGERVDSLPAFFGALADVSKGRALAVAGGILIRSEAGMVLGAIGASGDAADNEEACVLAGIKAAGLVATPD